MHSAIHSQRCHNCGAQTGHEHWCKYGVAGVEQPALQNVVPKASALERQVGGGHYKDMKIQPLEYCHANNIGKIEGDVIAYVSRWRKKNGIEDLRKAIHELEILIQLETEQE